jgi:RNA polymerase primary sigma factor
MSNLKEKELDLYYQYKNKNDINAKKELLNSLAPLINGQVNKYTNSGLPKLSIELEGFRLAGHALETYDPNKAQLNTHVTNNLKKLSRFVTDYQNIGHIPEPRALMIGQYNAVKSNLMDEKGREPTTQELADEMNLDIREVDRLQSELRKDLYMSNMAEDEDEIGFFEFVNPAEQTSAYQEALEFVYFDATPQEKRIIEAYTGLYGKPKKKTKDLLIELNMTESQLSLIRKKIAQDIKELL